MESAAILGGVARRQSIRRIQDAAAYVKLANESVTLETIKSAGGFVFSMRNDVHVLLLVIFDCSIIEITKPEERERLNCFNNLISSVDWCCIRPRLLSVV